MLTWSDALGKRVRDGDWADQAISTTRKLHEVVDAGQWEVAAQLVDYFMEEAKVCHVIYDVWSEGFERFLWAAGVTGDELEAERVRLARLLRFPDGEDFAPHPAGDASASWPAASATTCAASRSTRPGPTSASRSCASAGASCTTAGPTTSPGC